MSDESINALASSNDILNPSLNYIGSNIRVEIKGSCLKQDNITFNHGTTVNIYIVYEINKNFKISSYRILENCLFGGCS